MDCGGLGTHGRSDLNRVSIGSVAEKLDRTSPVPVLPVPLQDESWPQPVGAVRAFAFVRIAPEFLPFGFGFAAGAMVYLVLTEFVPEALDRGRELPRGGRPELVAGVLLGGGVMVPLLFV